MRPSAAGWIEQPVPRLNPPVEVVVAALLGSHGSPVLGSPDEISMLLSRTYVLVLLVIIVGIDIHDRDPYPDVVRQINPVTGR